MSGVVLSWKDTYFQRAVSSSYMLIECGRSWIS